MLPSHILPSNPPDLPGHQGDQPLRSLPVHGDGVPGPQVGAQKLVNVSLPLFGVGPIGPVDFQREQEKRPHQFRVLAGKDVEQQGRGLRGKQLEIGEDHRPRSLDLHLPPQNQEDLLQGELRRHRVVERAVDEKRVAVRHLAGVGGRQVAGEVFGRPGAALARNQGQGPGTARRINRAVSDRPGMARRINRAVSDRPRMARRIKRAVSDRPAHFRPQTALLAAVLFLPTSYFPFHVDQVRLPKSEIQPKAALQAAAAVQCSLWRQLGNGGKQGSAQQGNEEGARLDRAASPFRFESCVSSRKRQRSLNTTSLDVIEMTLFDVRVAPVHGVHRVLDVQQTLVVLVAFVARHPARVAAHPKVLVE